MLGDLRASSPVPTSSNRIEGRPGLQVVAFWGGEMKVYDIPSCGPVTIGRAPENTVRVDHASVSRQHALLHLGSELVIEDLGAANGTFVLEPAASLTETAGLRQLVCQGAPIAIGDTVMLGTVALIVRRAPEALSGFPDLEQPSLVGSFIVRDPQMRAVYAQAQRVAASPITVMLLGETGVGKEVLARAIHGCSARAKGPFLGVNCGALSESLLEAELFGHEKGAFTGAVQARPGLFEAANGGTLFLDEVGELPASTQVKLLRVLEERAVMRVGARTTRSIDVRFVAATNRDLEAEVASGRFRQDLYFRLNGIALTIPPLRQRPTEIEALAHAFVAAACRQMDRDAVAISDRATCALLAHRWPGNVRELRNAMERAVVLCAGARIEVDHLPAGIAMQCAAEHTSSKAPPSPPLPLGASAAGPDVGSEQFRAEVRSLERLRVMEALKRCGGNQTLAAKLLGISRRTLVSRLGQLDLPRPRKRKDG